MISGKGPHTIEKRAAKIVVKPSQSQASQLMGVKSADLPALFDQQVSPDSREAERRMKRCFKGKMPWKDAIFITAPILQTERVGSLLSLSKEMLPALPVVLFFFSKCVKGLIQEKLSPEHLLE